MKDLLVHIKLHVIGETYELWCTWKHNNSIHNRALYYDRELNQIGLYIELYINICFSEGQQMPTSELWLTQKIVHPIIKPTG